MKLFSSEHGYKVNYYYSLTHFSVASTGLVVLLDSCMYACMYICMCVCVRRCVYECMYVCLCVCTPYIFLIVFTNSRRVRLNQVLTIIGA